MENVKMWQIAKSFPMGLRYVVMETDSGYYLIDTDSPSFLVGYLSPLFSWFVSHTIMKIHLPPEEIHRLLLNKELQAKNAAIIPGLAGVSVILGVVVLPRLIGPILDPIFEGWYSDLSAYLTYLVLFFALFLPILLKIFLSRKSQRMMLTIIGKENLSSFPVSITPASISKGIGILGRAIGSVLACFAGFLLFVEARFWWAFVFGLFFYIGIFVNNGIDVFYGKYNVAIK